ncbi:molybdopterin biosynthesis protein [Thermogladius sp. 4427co]|uniref:molybdopterin biosynthesis protein n=1 Tax=Thermogladius sp. 4427co TaxID=3450718 RepID=UPI003F7A71EA
MSRKIFHNLVSIDEALSILEKHYSLKPLGVEEIDLDRALYRVLAEDIFSPIDYPPFDRSEVDGYAVRSTDVSWADELAPVKLRVVGRVEVGEIPGFSVSPGEAVEIATGSMLPRGADSVVMEEYTSRAGEEVLIYRSTFPGENVSTAGSDISLGDLVLVEGSILTPEKIGLLASLGYDRVKVYRKPKVAVFSTGREVLKPGSVLEPGKVYDTNSYLITSFLQSMGVDAKNYGILPDEEEVVYEALSKALGENDVVITSGGTSAGVKDVVYRVFNRLGQPGVIVHGLRIRPGKPTVIGVARGKLLIGLPGFPLSCYMVLLKLVKPIISRLAGLREVPGYSITARIPVKIRKRAGSAMFLPVGLVKTSRGYVAYPVSTSSGSVSSLVLSDGFLYIDEKTELVNEDEEVIIELMKPLEQVTRLNIIGSNDPLLYFIIKKIGLVNIAKIVPVGSLGGWKAVERGEADIAPTHLLDEEKGVYNTSFIEKFGLRNKAVVVKGYKRIIGLVVAKGNPKDIKSIKDFVKPGVRIVNRNKGSGVRSFIDMELKKISESSGISFEELVRRIDGYFYEVKTHSAVAVAVKQGRADVGIAVGWVAEKYGLDFIPLTWEEFDFVVPIDRLDKPEVRVFIEALGNKGFMNEILGYFQPYYQLSDEAGRIYY